MNNLCFYNSQAVYPQSDFNSLKQHPVLNNQMNMIEMINLLNKSQLSQQQNLIDVFMAKNQIQQNVPNHLHQVDFCLDQNNNFHSDEMLRKEMEQLRNLQRKVQQVKANVEPVPKEYILSQVKAQQRVKQIQQLLKEQQISSNYNQTNDCVKSLLNKNNNFNNLAFNQPQAIYQPDTFASQIEILNDGNVKNIPPNLLLDQFGLIGLAMMLRLNDSNSNLSMIIGKGEEAKNLTQSVPENFEYDSILVDSKHQMLNHLEQMNQPNHVYNLSSIKHELLDVNSVVKKCQEDLLFYFFYFCCMSEQQLLASSLLTSKGWFFNKELNLWLKQNFQDINSYFMFDVQSWLVIPKSLEELAKMHKSD